MSDSTPNAAPAAGRSPIIRLSRHSYGETIRLLSDAIAASGSTLFATIDQQAAAGAAELDLRPTTLLVFGNPRAGTPLMIAAPLFALELPVKLLIWEEAGSVSVAYLPLGETARRYGLTGLDAALAAIDAAVDKLGALVA